MNFVSKFDAVSPFAGDGAHPKAQLHVESVTTHAPSGSITVQDAHLLFNGDYKRTGLDLVITKDDREVVVPDYFRGEKRAPLASPEGAYLTGDIVNALAGHAQFAQADGSASAAKMIGHVTKLAGNATVIRNGVSIVLNLGDNVNQGDVVQSGSGSTLGITFIDGSVFGLGSNAKMVLNEMIYDPNGSNNSTLLSLVAGTISFVAGATAKHGDMKVDTPVATMGIRGTAMLIEIDFEVPAIGGAPPTRFQMLLEPDGTSGSAVLLDKLTLLPIATVNQPGTQTSVNGQGVVTFLSSANLSQEAQDIINKVFALKFSDNSNPNSNTKFTDSLVPQNTFVQLANGDIVNVKLLTVNVGDNSGPPTKPPTGTAGDHIPGKPAVTTANKALSEKVGLTASALVDTTSGGVHYQDVNEGDTPTVKITFGSYTYQNAQGQNVSAHLTATQMAAIHAIAVPLSVVQDPGGKNIGTATWTYNVADGALDFLADGESVTLTYIAQVDNNYAPNNETTFQTFTITVTGTNDTPVVATTNAAFTEAVNPSQPHPTGSTTPDTVTGSITFTDVDLTDTHAVTITGVSTSGVTSGLADNASVLAWLSLGTLTDSTDGVTGSRPWTFSAQDKNFDYLAVGEQLVLTYTIKVDDHHGLGGEVTKTVTITVTGSNDTPSITSSTQAASLIELSDTHDSTALDQAHGAVTFTDVDLSDTHAVTITGVAAAGVTSGLPIDSTVLSWLSLGAFADATAGVTGSRAWDFAAQDHFFDYLAVDEQVTLTYTIQVDDHHGGLITQDVTITVTGTNDTPVITSDVQAAAITELADTHDSSTPDEADGAVTFTDLDLSDSHEVTITGVSTSGVVSALPDDATVLKWLSLGDFADSGNGATGSQAWHFSAQDHFFDYLAVDEQVTLTYTIQVDDHHGGVVTQDVTITVTGTNDTPTVTSDAQTAPIPELASTTNSDTPDQADGAVTFTDLDWSNSHAVVDGVVISGVTSGLAAPATVQDWLSLGSFTNSADGTTGSQAWAFSAADKNFDYLAYNEQVTLTYTIQIADAHGGVDTQDVTITVTGSNDAPTANNDTLNSAPPLSEDSTLTVAAATLLANDTDPDLSDQLTVASVSATSASGATVTLSGTDIIYDPTSAAALQALAAGESATDTFTYTISDGHGGTSTATATVQISGANDAPVVEAIAGDSAGTAAPLPETDAGLTAGGTLTVRDVDTSDTVTLCVDQVTVSGASTSISLETLKNFLQVTAVSSDAIDASHVNADAGASHNIAWSFDSGSEAFDFLADGETLQLTYSIKVADGHGGVDTQDVAITVTGSNDAPVLSSGSASFSTDEDTALAINSLSYSDVDGGSSLEQVTLHVDHGTIVLGDTGALTGDLDGSDGTIVLDGTAAEIDAALASGLTYTPAANYSGSDTLHLAATDQNPGPGGSAVASLDVSIDVAPVAETPAPALALDATPQALGGEFRVNTTTANDQSYSAIGALSDGGYVITWVSDGAGIYGQRYDASGAPVGSEFHVNTSPYDNQHGPSVAGLNDGGFVVSWTSANDNLATIHAQRYDASGTAVGGQIDLSGYGENSTVAALSSGGFVLTYVSTDADHSGTYAVIFSATGTTGSRFLVNTATASEQQGDSVAATADGGFIVGWHSYGQDGDSWGVYFQRFDSSGNKLGAETLVNTNVAGTQYGGELAVLNDGTFVVSYIEEPSNVLVIRHFNATGDAFGADVTISNASTATVQALPDGGYLVTYMSNDATGSHGLFGQRVDASGSLSGSAFLINETVAGDQDFLADRSTPTAVLSSGTIVSTWFGAPDIGGTEIYARQFSLPGAGLEDTPISLALGTLGAGTDTDGSETTVIKLSGFPAGATFSKGAAGTGADAGFWVISDASDIASLSTTPLTMTPPTNYNGSFTLHIAAVTTDTATLSTGVVTDTATTTHDLQVTVIPDGYDAPTIDLDSGAAGINTTAEYNNVPGASSPVAITLAPLLTSDDGFLEGATIYGSSWENGDLLAINQALLPSGITADLSGGGVVLSGHASLSDYQAALQLVTFETTSPITHDREVFVTIDDGTNTTYASSFVSVTHVNTGPNHAPVAGPDAFTLGSTDSSLASSVLYNDTDADNDLLTVSGVVGGTLTGNYYLVEGTYGELRVYTDGGVYYTMGWQLNQSDPVHAAQAAAFNALAAGATADDTFTYTASDGQAGSDATLTFTVTSATVAAAAPQLMSQTFLGGAGDQAAADVSYAGGHLYLVYNSLPMSQTTSDNSTIVSFSTAADDAPTQDFSQFWNKGFFTGVASDGTNIYSVGASHPATGLTVDIIGGDEDKTLLAVFNGNGTPGNGPAPATGHSAHNFFPGYQGVELFQDVIATTQGGNTVLYAVGHGQPPAASGGYVIASYDSSGNLLHAATDPLTGGFSIARDVIEFNGQIWAVGFTQHSGDSVGRAAVWAANYDLSSVATYKDTVETPAGDFSGAAVIGSNLYAVGYVNSNSGDYLVAKYNTDGSVAWSHSFGGAGADYLNSAVALDGHLYVVGSTTDASGNTDGVLMEISTVDGSVISTTSYGGALYDSFNSITTDGHFLYIAGESKSFASGGNVAGQSDAILLTYDPGFGPVIETDQLQVAGSEDNGPTTVTGLLVTDSDPNDTLTLSATTAQAGVGSTITPASGLGDLSDINAAIGSVTYNPGAAPPDNDMITFTVTGANGSDTVHFVFNQAGNGPGITLQGTSGKDVIFATESNDTLTGGGGKDQFVFSDTSSGPVQHTITDFETTLDRLDLRQFSAIDGMGDIDITIAQQGSDTVITLDGNDTILLQNVLVANIHASNFIFHA